MATTSFSPTAVVAAVVTLLEAIPGSGTVASRIGESAGWRQVNRPKQPFWLVWVRGVREVPIAAPRRIEQRVTVQVALYVPFWRDENTQATFDALWPAALDTFRNNRDLDGVAEDSELPQVDFPDEFGLRSYADGEKTVQCHYAEILWEVIRDIDYSAP